MTDHDRPGEPNDDAEELIGVCQLLAVNLRTPFAKELLDQAQQMLDKTQNSGAVPPEEWERCGKLLRYLTAASEAAAEFRRAEPKTLPAIWRE